MQIEHSSFFFSFLCLFRYLLSSLFECKSGYFAGVCIRGGFIRWDELRSEDVIIGLVLILAVLLWNIPLRAIIIWFLVTARARSLGDSRELLVSKPRD